MGFIYTLADFVSSIRSVWDNVVFLVAPAFVFFTMSIFPFRFSRRCKLPILLLATVLDAVLIVLADSLLNVILAGAGARSYLKISILSFMCITAGALILYRENRLLIALTAMLLYNYFSSVRFIFIGLILTFFPDVAFITVTSMAILPTIPVLAVTAVLVVRYQKNAVSGLSTGELCIWFAVALLSMLLMSAKGVGQLDRWLMIVNALDLFVSTLAIYSLIFLYSRQKFVATEQQKILSNMEGYKGYLEQMRELNAHISTVQHEVKNHIFYIDQLLQLGDLAGLQEYVDRLKGEKSPGRLVSTGNAIVDSIVNAKFAYAQSLGIRTESDLQLPEVIRIDDLSLCSLLGNLLSNAIEATAHTEDAFIRLGIRPHKDYLLIAVDNTVRGDVLRENPGLSTTKKDAENHGIGLKVVRQIADVYEGDMQIEMSGERIFRVSVMLKNQSVPAISRR